MIRYKSALITVLVSFLVFEFFTILKEIDKSDQDNGETTKEVYLSDNTDTENLIVITLDGVRWQEVFKGADSSLVNNNKYTQGNGDKIKEKFWADSEKMRREKLMPFFWNGLEENGKLYGNGEYDNKVVMTNSSRKSIPGYSELWTGYAAPSINTNNEPPNPHINVLEFLNQQSGFQHDEVQAIVPSRGFERVLNIDRSNLLIRNVTNNHATIFRETMEVLKEDQPRLVYMAIVDTDKAAHNYQYDTYLNLIHEADSYIRNIWNFVQQHETYSGNTTLLITTDHGRGVGSEWHTHGARGGVDGADEIWFAIIGPDTEPSGEQKEKIKIEATQFAKTMAALLDLDFNNGRAEGNSIEAVINN